MTKPLDALRTEPVVETPIPAAANAAIALVAQARTNYAGLGRMMHDAATLTHQAGYSVAEMHTAIAGMDAGQIAVWKSRLLKAAGIESTATPADAFASAVWLISTVAGMWAQASSDPDFIPPRMAADDPIVNGEG